MTTVLLLVPFSKLTRLCPLARRPNVYSKATVGFGCSSLRRVNENNTMNSNLYEVFIDIKYMTKEQLKDREKKT